MFHSRLKKIAFCCIKEIIDNVLWKNECIILFAFCAVIEIMKLSTLHVNGTKMVWKLTYKDNKSAIRYFVDFHFVVRGTKAHRTVSVNPIFAEKLKHFQNRYKISFRSEVLSDIKIKFEQNSCHFGDRMQSFLTRNYVRMVNHEEYSRTL